MESSVSHWGKVFENNQYTPQWNENTKHYDYTLRNKDTFREYNRCVFEVSQEQYESLFNDIKKEATQTSNRNPTLQQDDSKMISLESLKENLYYNSTPIRWAGSIETPPLHNCTTWVLNKLDSIGIEVFNIKEWIPDVPVFNDLKELFLYLKFCNTIFLKFQNIDDNLKSITGAKAFRDWARSMTDNNYICYVDESALEKEIQGFCKRDIDNQRYYESIKKFYKMQAQLKSIYERLNTLLEKIIQKFNNNIKGDFELIYWDKQANKIKSLKAENDYNPIVVENFDLSIPANNCSISKFYPFIFIPKDKILSRMLYHKYDYGKVSESYQNAANEFYLNVLAGIQSDKYWSKSYHKLSKINKQFQVQPKELENV
ncbi:hypothetical protein T36_0461 [Helicobacter cinaedi]|uniref:hypothetical protein n=1 Tax=Helicobacter cinaedi TaxID=213 RepID=UPI001F253985|nr:hypothetical protein [Helicobacter cinaedi]BDB64014.1 hypothetical protein T36_0461 [Helicobacter cinaedi]